jgi:hypothetical protein
MRLARGVLAVACLGAGLWLMLRALGLLAVVLHGAGRWWPAFLLAGGMAILLRSLKPGPHIAVSVGLLGAGFLAFAITHGIISDRVWPFVAAGGLITAGIILAWLAVRTHPDSATVRSEQISVLFRAAEITLRSTELERVRVFLLCGHLELDLKDTVPPEQRRDAPLMVDVTAWVGNVHVKVRPEVRLINHKAFVLRLTHKIQVGVLAEKQTRTAQLVVATLAFFGDVEVKRETSDADSGVAGNQLEPGSHRPATW